MRITSTTALTQELYLNDPQLTSLPNSESDSAAKAAQEQAQRQPLPPQEIHRSRVAQGNIIFFFAVLILLGCAWKMRSVLEIVYVSALFAVVLMPLVKIVQRLRVKGWCPSRPIAILILIVGVALGLGVFFAVGLPPVINDAQHFAADLPQRIPELVGKIKKIPLANKIGIDQIGMKAEQVASSVAARVFAALPEILQKTLDLVTAFILCIYFMLEGEFAYYYFLSFFPAYKRERLANTMQTAEHRVSKWLIGQGSLMLILGVASTIAFGFLHVRYFVLLGVLMGLLNIIPIAGGVITILLAAGVAALDSWAKMAGVLVFYAVYIQVENAYLTPRIMKSSVDLAGLAVLISLLVGSALAGIVGALVAIPTAALIAVFVDEYFVQSDVRHLASIAKESTG